MPRVKYKKRPDGRKETTKVYKDFGTAHYSGRKHFYGMTDDEVDEKIAAFEAECCKPIEEQGRTVRDVEAEWWNKAEPKLALNSLKPYNAARKRIVEFFGDTPVKNIKARDIIRFLERYDDMSQKVISNTRCVFKQILDVALIDGDIDVNPAVALPAVHGKPRVRRKPAEEEDIEIIERCKTESMISRFFYFLLYTGLRRCEAVGVKGKDIDMQRKVLTVSRSITYRGTVPEEKVTKTEAGERSVELLDNVIAILPDGIKPDQYVFFPDGIPRSGALEKMLKEFETSHGLTCTPHQLRHSYASLLHSAGVDVKDAQHLLGHASISMTQDIYTHLDRQHKESVQSKLNSFVADQIKH